MKLRTNLDLVSGRSRSFRCGLRRSFFALVLLSTPLARAEGEAPTRPEPPVVIVSPPPPEPAPPAEEPPPPEPPHEGPAEHRFELWLGAAMFPAALGNARFVGHGTPVGGVGRQTFNRRGRELGLRNPTFWGPEFGIGYRQTYFEFALSAAFAGNFSTDATPTNAVAAALVGASSVKAYGGGLEVYGSIPLGRLTLSAGATAGFRGFSIPMVGFNSKTCTRSTRRGRYSYPCSETATTEPLLYLQPRVKVDVALNARGTLFLGAYAGVDALGDLTMTGGAQFGVRFGL